MTALPAAVYDYVVAFAVAHSCERIVTICADRAAGAFLAEELGGADGARTVSVIDDANAFLSQPDTQPQADKRFDLAIVVDALAQLSYGAGRQLLGRLRDTKAATVLVLVGPSPPDSKHWRLSDFIALGFRRSPDSRDLAPEWSLYRYDIRDYKITPSWLNSRHWANPERWDDERW